ncbi:MAG: hypothetical protein A2Z38_08020 [Planctomycetes bacterium RBG_19FT_COMBO_48_8]|nr:MAG: hypothetical protein A2Z38_08020 [Planctomycetes bacterium RBG_19FT_COMBO_48_8]
MVVENKNRKIEIFFIPCLVRTYIKNTVYNFVDFRIKSAGSSNYGGRIFRPRPKDASKKVRGKRQKVAKILKTNIEIQILMAQNENLECKNRETGVFRQPHLCSFVS